MTDKGGKKTLLAINYIDFIADQIRSHQGRLTRLFICVLSVSCVCVFVIRVIYLSIKPSPFLRLLSFGGVCVSE